jgi:hypothetical protein
VLDLKEGVDYVRVCMGENGFGDMIDDLTRKSAPLTPGNETRPYYCDVGVSSITASTDREAAGIRFSRPTLRSNLAVMVMAPVKRRGMWAFFEPFELNVWVAIGLTVIVIPFFVCLGPEGA